MNHTTFLLPLILEPLSADTINPFMHNVEKWPNILKYCGVHTARILKYVWPLFNLHETVNTSKEYATSRVVLENSFHENLRLKRLIMSKRIHK